MFLRKGCSRMKRGGTGKSPSFKFQVVLEALKAEGKGKEARIARAYDYRPPMEYLKVGLIPKT